MTHQNLLPKIQFSGSYTKRREAEVEFKFSKIILKSNRYGHDMFNFTPDC